MTDLHLYDADPHELYMTAVATHLTAANLPPLSVETSPFVEPSSHPRVDGWITVLLPDEKRWPNGLILHWSWSHGDRDGLHADGPRWVWSPSMWTEPASLRVDGYADPADVARAVRCLAKYDTPGVVRTARWADAPALETALHAWASREFVTEGSGAR